ncbi:phenylacetaldoxime dehydratase [Arthroderma uncinatum]|uniref:phenylacetaldoxime dehydratase n=1 Tax=Arthroderma uncinatum TaxID=74035 RepID=UPI00144A665C|nr:phenylacetaldoxime dehydratase [Arthroderma uncinatum]KAF3491618.1 phenylacetaldoxime dehydratase [Arthroderma uncinatum]
MLEASIPPNLVQERTRPVSTPANHEPPFPAYTSRFPEHTKDLVMAIIGAQYASAADNDGAAISKILEFIKSSPDIATRPSFWELISVTDPGGSYNLAAIAYWPSRESYEKWGVASGFSEWWERLDVESERHGWFLEEFSPTIDRLETVFSGNEILEGAAHMQEKWSGPIQEHVYWGSMRDRFPVAQTDAITGDTSHNVANKAGVTLRRRIRVPGKQNLAIIRSGQDWSNTYPEERKLYLGTMHPVLTKGMDFLRDHGEDVGCYSCRLMDVVDTDTFKADKDRTFGLAYFNDLSSLEGWSKQHKTHLAIFGGFLQYAKKLENNISLRLFHEVLVLKPEQQFFEYLGCHENFGMLVSL